MVPCGEPVGGPPRPSGGIWLPPPGGGVCAPAAAARTIITAKLRMCDRLNIVVLLRSMRNAIRVPETVHKQSSTPVCPPCWSDRLSSGLFVFVLFLPEAARAIESERITLGRNAEKQARLENGNRRLLQSKHLFLISPKRAGRKCPPFLRECESALRAMERTGYDGSRLRGL